MDEHEMFAGFEGFRNAEYAQEAQERWGETEAYRESLRRARSYSPEDWTRIRSEGEAIEARLVEIFRRGEPPGGVGAMDAVEAHRAYLDRWFFPVDHALHCCFARLYVDDPRFRAHYDALAPGLAAFVEAAVRANALRAAEEKGAGEG